MALNADELASEMADPAKLIAMGVIRDVEQKDAARIIEGGLRKLFRSGGKPVFVSMSIAEAKCFDFFKSHGLGGGSRAWLAIVGDGLGHIGYSIFQENMAALDPQVRAQEARACAQVVACSKVIKQTQWANRATGSA